MSSRVIPFFSLMLFAGLSLAGCSAKLSPNATQNTPSSEAGVSSGEAPPVGSAEAPTVSALTVSTDPTATHATLTWTPAPQAESQICAYQAGSEALTDCTSGFIKNLAADATTCELSELPPDSPFAARICTVIDGKVVSSSTMTGKTPAAIPTITASYDALTGVHIVLDAKDNPESTEFAVQLKNGSTTYGVDGKGKLSGDTQWKTHADLGGKNGIYVTELPPGQIAIAAKARNSSDQETSPSTTIVVTVPHVPVIEFSSIAWSFTKGVTIDILPTNAGEPAAACASNPTLPAGLALGTNCRITGAPTTNQASANYVITASNADGNAIPKTLSIAVVDPLPLIGYAGSPFSFTRSNSVGTIAPVNTGGPIASCVASPTLPAGLTLSNTCVISGTPTAVQVGASYAITATNSGGSAAPINISIAVVHAVPSISYSGAPFLFVNGTSVGTIVPGNAGGPITGCTANVALPTGLTLSSACVITGTPLVTQGGVGYIITPTNSTGSGVGISVSITVKQAVPSISYPGSPFHFINNVSIGTITPPNTGGTVASCSPSPALPAGISLSASCQLSGAATSNQAATNYTITATNSTGSGAGVVISIAVTDALPSISYPGTPYTVIQNVLTSIMPTNNGEPITNCTANVALPAGMTLDPTDCSISGTPTTVQISKPYTITPFNSGGNGSAVTMYIRVQAPPASTLYYKVSSGVTTYPGGTSGSHNMLSNLDGMPSGETFVLWQADYRRNSGTAGYIEMKSGSTTVETSDYVFQSNTAIDSMLRTTYYPNYNSSTALEVWGVSPVGSEVTINRSQIFAFDVSGTSVYDSGPTACSGTVQMGIVPTACTLTVPGGKSGENWLFFARIKANTTLPGEAFALNSKFRFASAIVGTPGTQNIEPSWTFDAVVPFIFNFPDNASKDFQLEYTAVVGSGAGTSNVFSVTLFGMNMDTQGEIIDFDRTSAVVYGQSGGLETYSSKSVSIPASGDYLVLQYLKIDSPSSDTIIRTSVGGSQTNFFRSLGGGSGMKTHLTTAAVYHANSSGAHTFLTEFQSTTNDASTILEGNTVVFKMP